MPRKAMTITEKNLDNFKGFIVSKGLSKSTLDNYLYDAKLLAKFIKGKEITPELLEDFKEKQLKKFNIVSVKGMICGVNSYLEFIDSPHRMEQIKAPKREKRYNQTVLTKEEYLNVLKALKRYGSERLYLIVESICGAGLKLSELNHLTVEAVIRGKVVLPPDQKNVYLSKNLCNDLLQYCKENDIFAGTILVTRNGRLPDRANVSREIKSACADTGIDLEKLSTRALRDYYFRNYENYRSEIVEMMDEDWRGKSQ